ncbi:MAG: sulfotransferase [Candidatus Limnocylindria bacterium]
MTRPARPEPLATPEEGPITGPLFMVGCARTGSTLLRHILNRSPAISMASETHFMQWARRHRLERRLAGVRAASDPSALRDLVDRLFRPDFWVWLGRNVTREELEARLRSTDLTERAVFETLLELYAERRGGLPRGRGLLGEKTPAHLRDVPRLNEWFPTARFIHTFRDPRGIYLSELRRMKQGRWGPKARLPWIPGAILEPLLAPIEALSTTVAWHRAARLHRRYEGLLGERYRLVRFEDLVASPEQEVRAICEFIDVPFDPSMLEGIDVVGSSFEERRHAASGIDQRTAGRWRHELNPLVRTWFSMALGRQLGRFGYRA